MAAAGDYSRRAPNERSTFSVAGPLSRWPP
jgi:hypothetical protein